MALFFVELLVRGTLLCLLIALTLLALRRAAATYRHLLCTLALVGLLTLPLVQELLPPLPLLKADKPVVLDPGPLVPQRFEPIPQPLPSAPRGYPGRGEAPPGPSLPQGGSGGGQPSGFDLSFLWPLSWALGATTLLVRLAVALVRLRQLARRSQSTSLLETKVLVSENITTPLTWGVRRPVILLPTALLTGDPAVAESALRHEKAHIARRDWLWHLLAEVVCALCWFQPGAWWLRRRLRAESERACDDRVLLSGISGPDYAAHLLEILKVGRASSLAPEMAAAGSMEARVKHILDPKKPRHSQRLRLALTAALGLVLLPLASLKVAAKPGERSTNRLQEAVELLAPKLQAPLPLAEPALAKPSGTPLLPQPLTPTPAPETPEPPRLALEKAVWGEAVDGLEPGFLLLSSDPVPQNSRLVYQTLVRNKSNKPISFFVRMLRDNGPDRPSFGVKQAEGIEEPYPFDPLYEATLVPGEAMLVPVQQSRDATLELVVGDDGSKDRPRVSKIVPGQYRITQPITLYRGLEKSQLIRLLGSDVPEVKKISPDGTLRTERSSRAAGEKPLPSAQTLEATRMLTVVAPLPGAPGPTLLLDKVIWNEAVDGLAAGFLLTGVTLMEDKLGTTKIGYQTLVRNTSNKPISFLTRLLQYDGYEAPTVDGKPTKGAKRGYPFDPLYSVTLAPGESVIVPAQNGRESLEISVGEGGSNDSPSIAAFTPGHLKIVQPINIYRSPENLKLSELMGIYTLSKVSPDGRVHTEPANRATGLGGGTGRIDGGQTLEAYSYLEVGTLNAAAERNASAAVWGKVDKGLQCGIRLLTDQRVFKTGETLEAEFLWRNTTSTPITTPLPRASDLYPILSDTTGHGLPIDFGARLRLYPPAVSLGAREIRSLGVVALTLVLKGTPSPTSNLAPGHITLAPGTYKLSGFGGVSAPGGPNPQSGEATFTVVGDAPSQNDVELSLRLPKGVTTFAKLGQARFEVVLHNRTKNPVVCSWLGYPTVNQFGPDLFTKDGEPIPYVHTLAGPYQNEGRELAPGESAVLGTIALPSEVQREWDSLPQGPYLASGPPPPSPYEARFSLGVTVAGKREQTLRARLPFTVSRLR